MKTLLELQPLIVEWATSKNIHFPECAPKQRLKLIEEVGELASAILKEDIDKQKDAIGDIFVVLIILSEQMQSDLEFEFEDIRPLVKDNLFEYINHIINISGFLFSELAILEELACILNLNLVDCANIAWKEIKDRQGITKNGTFIKN
jgi:MazG nucleotide pyrophosphohydrolase domain